MINKPFILGLTGSIGMGKTTTAGIFRFYELPVWDADDAVNRIYAAGGGGAKALSTIIPEAVSNSDKSVNKEIIISCINSDPTILVKIEEAIHPLVQQDRNKFIERCALSNDILVIAEVSLLFETKMEDEFNAIAVVTTSKEIQKNRVLRRKGMTVETFEMLNSRQLPDSEKCKRADFIIRTDNQKIAYQDISETLDILRAKIFNNDCI